MVLIHWIFKWEEMNLELYIILNTHSQKYRHIIGLTVKCEIVTLLKGSMEYVPRWPTGQCTIR
jgi:hypothetical protein